MPRPLASSPALASATPLSRSDGCTLPPPPPLRPPKGPAPKGPRLRPRETEALGGREGGRVGGTLPMVCARLMVAAGLVRGRVRVRFGIGEGQGKSRVSC